GAHHRATRVMVASVQTVIKQTSAFIEAMFYVLHGQCGHLIRDIKPCVLGGPKEHQMPAAHRKVGSCRTGSAPIEVSDVTPASFIRRRPLRRLALDAAGELNRLLDGLLNPRLLVPWRRTKYLRQHQARDGVVVGRGVRRSALDKSCFN